MKKSESKHSSASNLNGQLSTIGEIELKYKTKTDVSEIKKILCSQDAENELRKMFDEDTIEHHESFIAIFCNRANKPIGWYKLSQGGITGTIIDVKMLFQAAINTNASGIFISHNHPSGELKPSEPDIQITKKIKKACEFFDITLFDHIIITKSNYYSFADNGIL